MLNFNKTLSIPEFVANHGITSVSEITLDNGKQYLLADNGISIKTSAVALSALHAGATQSLRISDCHDDDKNEDFFMLHVSNSLGKVTHTFTF